MLCYAVPQLGRPLGNNNIKLQLSLTNESPINRALFRRLIPNAPFKTHSRVACANVTAAALRRPVIIVTCDGRNLYRYKWCFGSQARKAKKKGERLSERNRRWTLRGGFERLDRFSIAARDYVEKVWKVKDL